VDKKKKKLIYATNSPAKTSRLGGMLAKTILESGKGDRARVLLLRGDLGAGKTQFTQGFAKGLGVRETVNSPTFIIMKNTRWPGKADLIIFTISIATD